MPNVMGREFPYTPEGMAASQQYAQSMGMRDGGPMGFRPVGMGIGGTVFKILEESGKYPALFQQLSGQEAQGPKSPPPGNAFFAANPDRYAPSTDSWALDSFRSEFGREPRDTAELQEYMMSGGGAATEMRDGGMMGFRPLGYADGDAVNANRQVYSDFKTALTELPANELAGYIYNNLSNLKSMAEANPALAAQLADAMEKSGFEGYMRNLIQGAGQVPEEQVPEEQGGNLGRMGTSPQGMSDFPGYEPGTGDFYPPQQQVPQQQVPQQLPPSPSYPPFGGAEEGDQYLIPGTPPPGAVAPIPYDPNEIEVANGGYISRKMNNGGLMSLRRR